MSDAVAEAERRFGPRYGDYFYAGHEFVARHPGTWYPGNRGHIVIQLGLECTQDMTQAIYQLAHEAIHLLAPTGAASANNLEEGLATWFAEDYCRRATGRAIATSLPSYQVACDAVRSLIELAPDCIRLARETEPCISRISASLIGEHCPELSDEQAHYLSSKFVRSA